MMKPPDETMKAFYWVKCRQRFRVDEKVREWWEIALWNPGDSTWYFAASECGDDYEVVLVGEELHHPGEAE